MIKRIRLFLIRSGFPIVPRDITELEARTWRIAKDIDAIIIGWWKPASDIHEIRRGRIGMRKYFGDERGGVIIVGDSGKFLDRDSGRKI